MEYIIQLFKKESSQRIIIFVLFGAFIYFMKDMLNLFLLTFLLTYLTNSLQKFVLKHVENFLPIKEKIMIIIIYILLASLLGFVIVNYIPKFVDQSKSIINQVGHVDKLKHTKGIEKTLLSVVQSIDLKSYIKNSSGDIVDFVANVGKWGVNIFGSLILSMFFMLEKDKVKKFMLKFKTSRVSNFYRELHYFGMKFLNSFGKVMQAQILIAFTNSILSVIALSIMGFPQLIALGFMIFLLTLIPVAGTIISLVPLSLIAFNIGGFIKVIYILVLIAVLHALETYVLNPKFMSAKTELPVFFTFLILLVSEHFMGVWGLIIGIPIFMFILDLLNVNAAEKN